MHDFNLILIKLTLAALAGLLLGLERESKHKPLGLKTCAVIAIASCLLTIVSIEAAISSYNESFFIRADPMRLAAQIVSGVGFLGAGVILRRSNDAISGLTTAAIVWAASGFGIAIGAGYFVEVTVGLILIFVTVSIIPMLIRMFGPHALKEQEVLLRVYAAASTNVKDVIQDIEKKVIHIRNVKIKGDMSGHEIELYTVIDE